MIGWHDYEDLFDSVCEEGEIKNFTLKLTSQIRVSNSTVTPNLIWIWANQPIRSFLVECLSYNPGLQKTNAWVGSPQPLDLQAGVTIPNLTHRLE
jgi:hypothetical protein